MNDDEIDEIEHDSEAEDGFEADAGNENSSGSDEDDSGSDTDAVNNEDDSGSDADSSDAKNDAEKSANDILIEKAAKLAESATQNDANKSAATQVDAKQAELKDGDALVEDEIQRLLGMSSDVKGKAKVGDTEFDVEEFAKDFPEAAAYAKIIAAKAAEDAANKRISQVESVVNELRFWDALRDVHSDAKSVSASSEFAEWIVKQPSGVKAMASSENVQDAIYVLNAYKETNAKAKTDAIDGKFKAKREKESALFTHALKSSKSTNKSGKSDMDDFAAGFNGDV